MSVQLLHGDCLEVMPALSANSVQMVFADLPYGETACDWDNEINLLQLWPLIAAIGKANYAALFTATMRFCYKLIGSNPKMFRHDWVWEKPRASGVFNVKKAPLRAHEHILLFSRPKCVYNPQMKPGRRHGAGSPLTQFHKGGVYGARKLIRYESDGSLRYPRSVQNFAQLGMSAGAAAGKRLHPTQKPEALLEFLIKTYTNPGDTVLDPVFGSATTAIACLRTGRSFVGIEKDPGYYELGRHRVAEEQRRLGMEVTV